jgi:hypothetical protein
MNKYESWANEIIPHGKREISDTCCLEIVDRIPAETKNRNGANELRRQTQSKPATRLNHGHKPNKANLKTKLQGTMGDMTAEN